MNKVLITLYLVILTFLLFNYKPLDKRYTIPKKTSHHSLNYLNHNYTIVKDNFGVHHTKAKDGTIISNINLNNLIDSLIAYEEYDNNM